MIFESLWPLAFLLAVPVVVILYLLVPKGQTRQCLRICCGRSFFIMNSLKRSGKSFAQSADVSADRDPLLLILALMAPFIQRKGTGSTDVVYLIDTSGSMKHLTKGAIPA